MTKEQLHKLKLVSDQEKYRIMFQMLTPQQKKTVVDKIDELLAKQTQEQQKLQSG